LSTPILAFIENDDEVPNNVIQEREKEIKETDPLPKSGDASHTNNAKELNHEDPCCATAISERISSSLENEVTFRNG